MITVLFEAGSDYAEAAGKLWQWDYGRVLRIQGLDLPTAAEIHFSLQSVGGEAITRIGIARDGVTDVVIPDSLLEGNQTQPYYIHMWVYQTDDTGGRTTKSARIWVNTRPKPEAFDTPEDAELFREAITAVNDAAARAEAAGGEAGAAKEAAESARTAAEAAASESQEARAAAGLSAGEAAGYKDQAANSATLAALSERAADESGKLAGDHAARAEVSADAAHEDAGRTAQDRIQTGLDAERTARDWEATAQDRKAVAADRAAVGQDKADVDTAATRAITDIRDAKDASITAISNEGARQVSVVTEAGGAQVSAVSREGAAQVQAVQEAAAGIMADREQIAANKTDIGALTDRVDMCAPGIIVEATGATQVTVGDASDAPVANMEIAGKSDQVVTTGAQLLDLGVVTGASAGGATISVDGRGYTISGTGALTTSFEKHYRTDIKRFLRPGNLILKSEITIPRVFIYIRDGNTLLDSMYGNMTKQITQEMLDNENVYIELLLFGSKDTVITPGTYHPMLYQSGNGTWEPYTGGKSSPSPEYPQEIVSTDVTAVTVTGAQLMDTSKLARTHNDVTFSIREDGGILVTGNTLEKLAHSIVVSTNLLPGTYYVSGSVPIADTKIFVKAKKWYSDGRADVINDTAFIVNGTEAKIEYFIYIYQGLSDINEIVYPMLNAGDTPLPWQPYQSKTATITLTEPLRSIGDHRDEITMTKRIDRCVELVFDGSEDWSTHDVYSGFVATNVLAGARRYADGYCNQMSVVGRPDAITPNSLIIGLDSRHLYARNNQFYDAESADKGLSAWKAHLAAHPLVVVTYLDTPVETDLDAVTVAALAQLTTYKGHTTVSAAAGGPEPDITLEYVADTKTYIENEHAKMQTEFDRQIAAILALLPAETQAAMINNETSALLAESEV